MGDLPAWLWKQFAEATVKLVITSILTALAVTVWVATRKSAPDMTSFGWLLVGVGVAFAIVLLFGAAGWARSKWGSGAAAGAAPAAIDTRLRLHSLGTKRIPQQLSEGNIWRWFSWENIARIQNADGSFTERSMNTFVAIVFDQPTTFAQIVVSSPNIVLPVHQVRDHSPRHAIIEFDGEIGVGEIEIRAIR